MAEGTTQHTIEVQIAQHEDGAMFLRSPRAEGTAPNGEEVEVAINEGGYGILVTIDHTTYSLNERDLVAAILRLRYGGDN